MVQCSHKTSYICGSEIFSSRPTIEGKILRFERVAFSDTTVAIIYGHIFSRDSMDKHVSLDTLQAAVINAIDKATGKVYRTQVDLGGEYELLLPPSSYILKIHGIAHNTLVVQNVKLETSDMIEFNAALGVFSSVIDSTVYDMNMIFPSNYSIQKPKDK